MSGGSSGKGSRGMSKVMFSIGEGREREDITYETVRRLKEEHEEIDRFLSRKFNERSDAYEMLESEYIEHYTLKYAKDLLKEYMSNGYISDDDSIAIIYKDGKTHYYLGGDDEGLTKTKLTGIVGMFGGNASTTWFAGTGIKLENYAETNRNWNVNYSSDWRLEFADNPKERPSRTTVPEYENAIKRLKGKRKK